jgi:glyoxylase-like metal-dependent hydrolase (beta-lactamase superfamily II)
MSWRNPMLKQEKSTVMMIRIGDLEIHLMNDAIIQADAGGPFGLVPRALWNRTYQHDDQFRIEMHHHCLLVRGAGKSIVVDTGIGSRVPEKVARLMALDRPGGGLVGGLAALGLTPEDIDLVINTHLHSDHCGGNTRFANDGQLVPTFPNAEYWTQRREYADAYLPNERTRGTYFRDNFVPLYESGQMKLIDGEVEVVSGMRCVLTPGHTPAHMSIVFEGGGKSALYVADMASLAVHFTNLAWMTAYDVEPLITLETKRIWQQWALERDAIILFEHEPLTPVGRLAQGENDKLVLESIATDS